MDRYVQCICKELTKRKDYIRNEPVHTIYFGGGTPSQMQKRHFEQIFETIHNVYGTASCREITLEANPDDLNSDYLKEISSLPFNRISIGIQTFDDQTLKLLKRRHTAQQAIDAVTNCRLAGFDNISIDLIYGLPGESIEGWRKDLRTALRLNVEHISAYHLIYEEGTPLYAMLENRSVTETNEDDSYLFFSTLIDTLTSAGYEHYEISNFCLPGKQSLHNSSYWNGSIYMGCGPSAHSYNGNERMWNVSILSLYMDEIEKNGKVYDIETLNKDTRYNDLIITSLRTSKGLSLDYLKSTFGSEFYGNCLSMAQKHIDTGSLEVKNGYLRLTLKGIFVSDGIMSDLLRV